jgi:hypothetical protein
MQVQEIKRGDRVKLTLEFTAAADVTINQSADQPWAGLTLGEHEDPMVREFSGGMGHFSLEVPLTHDDVEVAVERA